MGIKKLKKETHATQTLELEKGKGASSSYLNSFQKF